MSSVEDIIQTYNSVVKVIDQNAREQNDRSYGGIIRATKGRLQEYITEETIKLAWNNINGDNKKLKINSKKIKIPIQKEYINNLKNEDVKKHILQSIDKYYYGLSVDKQIFIDNKFVIGIECKAFTENAMLKRILVDFHLLKTKFPDLSCYLFQLESQLGGDYSELPNIIYGAKSTHTIMSYFEDVNLNIFTFLQGERNINKPIHKNFKELDKNIIEKAIEVLSLELKKFL